MGIINDIAGATFAFSVSRYLRTASEGTAVCRLRRNNNATLQDFKLNASNVLVTDDANLRTVTAWKALTSATDVFVERVYDQSGNARSFIQATNANQPKLIESSALNSLAVIDFSQGNNSTRLTSGSISITPASGIEVHSIVRLTNSFPSPNYIFGSFASSLAKVGASTVDGWEWQSDNGDFVNSVTTPSFSQTYQASHRYRDSNLFDIDVDGVAVMTGEASPGGLDWRSGIHVMGNSANGTGTQRAWGGLIAEIIFYNGNYSTGDTNDIQTSQGIHAGTISSSYNPAFAHRRLLL